MQGMDHWADIASSFKNAREALFPVFLDDARVKRKCLLLRVSATEASETLLTASRLCVQVCGHVARKALGRELAQKVVGLIRSVGSGSGAQEIDVVIEQDFPAVDMDYDVGLAVLGMLATRVVDAAGEKSFPVTSKTFVQDMAVAMKNCFGFLRNEVACRGSRDVLRVLDDESACRRALKYLCCDDVAAGMPIDSAHEHASAAVSERVPVASRMSLKVLTWNIAGDSTSRQAPSSVSYTHLTLPTKA